MSCNSYFIMVVKVHDVVEKSNLFWSLFSCFFGFAILAALVFVLILGFLAGAGCGAVSGYFSTGHSSLNIFSMFVP